MDARDDFGVPVLLADTPPKRRVDWQEPHGEGDWLLEASIAGDDDDR